MQLNSNEESDLFQYRMKECLITLLSSSHNDRHTPLRSNSSSHLSPTISYRQTLSNVIARHVKSSHQNDPGRMSSKFCSHFSPFVPFFNPAPARITERNSSFIFLNRFVRRDSDLIPRPSNRISTSLLTNTHRSPWVPPSPQKNSLISPRCP